MVHLEGQRQASLSELRGELAAAGLGPRGAGRVYAKLALLLGIAVGLFAVALAAPLAVRLPLLAVASWFYIAAVMCGHDGSHRAVSRRRWVNELLAWSAFTFLGGLSNYYWREKHNVQHHPYCNIPGRDPDVVNAPFAFSRAQHERASGLTHAFQRIQAWLFLPICLLFLVPLMRFSGLRRVLRGLVEGEDRAYAAIDLGFLALHLAGWVVPLLLGAAPLAVLTLYLATTLFGGLYLAAIFAPAHLTAPLVASSTDPLLLQLTTTRNLRTSWFFRFTMIGLDQQVEHHLAPWIPHFDLARSRPIVQAYCARHALPYHQAGWARSLLDTHLRLNSVADLAEIVVGDPPLAASA